MSPRRAYLLCVLTALFFVLGGCGEDADPVFIIEDDDAGGPLLPFPAQTAPPPAPVLNTPANPPAQPDDGTTHNELANGLNSGLFSLRSVRQRGLGVFSTPFLKADGFGDGPFDPTEFPPFEFGHRPTLQDNGTILRVNGLDAQSCNECHTIVSNLGRPPVLGIAGVGGMVQNAIILPTLIDVGDSFDDRVLFVPGHDPDLPLAFDGDADFNGRMANPPFLFGGGGVELLAKEMTADLQDLLDVARNSPPGTVTSLDTHGVNFGSITTLPGGQVQLDVEGIGFTDNTAHSPEEVLVVRPFGRKGENFSMRDFDRGAMQFHFGVQPVEVVGENVDEDRDGILNEVTVAQMTALHVFDVTNPRPIMETQDIPTNFTAIGCADCHIPFIDTRSRFLPLAFPEVADDPFQNVYTEIDLVAVGFEEAPGGGVRVPLFADLKRHDMGLELEEDFEMGEIPNEDFTTARLWGVADTAPYLHDGRALTLLEAILAHGGEAEMARDNFNALTTAEQTEIVQFLLTLRTPVNANFDLLDDQ